MEDLSRSLERLQEQFEGLKSDYERRLAELERRILRLSAATSQPPAEKPAAPKRVTFTGGQRTLQALNPEISITGDATVRFSTR